MPTALVRFVRVAQLQFIYNLPFHRPFAPNPFQFETMARLGRISLLISVILLFTHKTTDASPTESENDSQSSTQFTKLPTVLMVLLFRNKAHTMPYFLNFIHRLDYPKDRISLWLVCPFPRLSLRFVFSGLLYGCRIRSDHNEDKTLEVLHNWLSSFSFQYHSVNVEYDKKSKRRTGEVSPTHWTPERHADLIRLKEEALDHARAIWSDYVFVCLPPLPPFAFPLHLSIPFPAVSRCRRTLVQAERAPRSHPPQPARRSADARLGDILLELLVRHDRRLLLPAHRAIQENLRFRRARRIQRANDTQRRTYQLE